MPKLLRISTEPITFKITLAGQFKFLREKGWEVILVSADGREVFQVCSSEGVSHVEIPFAKGLDIIHDFTCFLNLVSLFKKEKPDMVHSHGAKAGFLSMLAASFAGISHRIHTVSDMPFSGGKPGKENSLRFTEKWTFAKASELWVISTGMLNYFSSKSLVSDSKLKLVGKGSSNGIDLSKFNRSALKENHLVAATMRILPGENEFILMVVGGLSKQRGTEDLVAAFLSSKILSASKLVLIGPWDKSEEGAISTETAQHVNEHAKIIHIDWTDHIEHHLALADVLVQPSDQEGFSTVLLEAAAMQVPVICSDGVGNTSLVMQKKSGLIYPAGDVSVLKEAIEFAFVKRDFMAACAEQLAHEVEKHYDRKSFHTQLLQNYERVLQQG